MSELKSRFWIITKGVLFLGIALVSAVLLWLQVPDVKTALLLMLLAWSAARFYYFLFYVLEKYVDPSLKYPGVTALILQWLRQWQER